ncbi:MAG: hypothetical protein IKA28_02270 [Tidjanibacter sp.]|nr:hypothetical protein [Tidjanibacter sp.]
MMKRVVMIVMGLLMGALTAFGQLSMPNIFDDDMVLQQGKPVALWGEARPGAKVTARFADQRVSAVADAEGKWSLHLAEMTASAEPRTLVVSSGREKLTYNNVLVGEVWLASGQSNMEYSMGNHNHYVRPARGDRDVLMKAYYEADAPLVRVLYVSRNMGVDTLPTNGWHPVGRESLRPVSAAGYFFAKELADSLRVPIGLISSSWGGTPVEEWTPKEAFCASEQFGPKVDERGFFEGVKVAYRYDKLIAPMVPYTLRGFVWYNGEQNLITGDTDVYAPKQMLMVESWRELWNDNQMPFYYVQLAPYAYSQRRSDAVLKCWDALPRFRDAQTAAMAQPHTGMVVTTDLVDDLTDIHPPYKWVVGHRLALWALADTYGYEHLVAQGPTYANMTIEGNKVVVEFTNVAEGLRTADGKAPTWFRVAGADGRFYDATAHLVAPNRVEITAPQRVPKPLYVSFGWDEIATPNLVGGTGLPAVPFNTLQMK